MAAADNDSNGRQGQWQTMTAVDNNCMQDWAADYDGEGCKLAARDGGVSGVVMMVAVAEDGGSGQQQQRQTVMVGDNDGTQD